MFNSDAFHCGISHFIIVFDFACVVDDFGIVYGGIFDEITWVGWSRSRDCAAQLR